MPLPDDVPLILMPQSCLSDGSGSVRHLCFLAIAAQANLAKITARWKEVDEPRPWPVKYHRPSIESFALSCAPSKYSYSIVEGDVNQQLSLKHERTFISRAVNNY